MNPCEGTLKRQPFLPFNSNNRITSQDGQYVIYFILKYGKSQGFFGNS